LKFVVSTVDYPSRFLPLKSYLILDFYSLPKWMYFHPKRSNPKIREECRRYSNSSSGLDMA